MFIKNATERNWHVCSQLVHGIWYPPASQCWKWELWVTGMVIFLALLFAVFFYKLCVLWGWGVVQTTLLMPLHLTSLLSLSFLQPLTIFVG